MPAIDQNPDIVEAYLILAICYYRQGDYSQARRCLHKVLDNQGAPMLKLKCRASG